MTERKFYINQAVRIIASETLKSCIGETGVIRGFSHPNSDAPDVNVYMFTPDDPSKFLPPDAEKIGTAIVEALKAVFGDKVKHEAMNEVAVRVAEHQIEAVVDEEALTRNTVVAWDDIPGGKPGG